MYMNWNIPCGKEIFVNDVIFEAQMQTEDYALQCVRDVILFIYFF